MRRFLLVPFDNQWSNNEIFKGPCGVLRDLLRKQGIDLQTYDRGDPKEAEKIIFFNHHPNLLRVCEENSIDKSTLFLFLFEPEVVFPGQYRQAVWDRYGSIATCRDDLCEKYSAFYKFRYPQAQQFRADLRGFTDRKYITLINSNWYSYVPNELYSYRREAIRYFENHAVDFDLYGAKWNNNSILSPQNLLHALQYRRMRQYLQDVYEGLRHYKSYRGIVPDKYAALSRYRFAICFENERNTKGYITEKIFDCFFAGTVPIYLGATNISEYVPGKCYIDMGEYAGFAQLDRKLKCMSEAEWLSYYQAGQDFIRSSAFEEWRPERVFQHIADIIL